MAFDLRSFNSWWPPHSLKSRIHVRRRKVGSIIAIKYDEELPFGLREIGVASDCQRQLASANIPSYFPKLES
jgi:hypothetical protein